MATIEPYDGRTDDELLGVWEAAVRPTLGRTAEADSVSWRRRMWERLRAARCFVVRDGAGGVAAFAGLVDDRIELFFVTPAMQGRGLGTELVAFAAARGIRRIDVAAGNDAARRFCLRRGFVPCGREGDALHLTLPEAFHPFARSIDEASLPARFTYPFCYVPHPLCVEAAQAVQRYVAGRREWRDELARGKMFGVLVVRTREGGVGYLAAFSGNLAGRNRHDYFVPPVYDMLRPDGFFRRGEAHLAQLGERIAALEADATLAALRRESAALESAAREALAAAKERARTAKCVRDRRRAEGADEAVLIAESQRERADLRRLKAAWRLRVEPLRRELTVREEAVAALRHERREASAALQRRLFGAFRMLDVQGEVRDLLEIFASTPQGIPPAGAGECAAPKLLQHAYRMGLQPLAMAEFWWGASPREELRRHGDYYPACRGKCGPILAHMLRGLAVDPDPLAEGVAADPVVRYEDEWLALIDKPAGMLSVPGRTQAPSAEGWACGRWPGAKVVHRLDMATSGLLVVAKNGAVHAALQGQFRRREVQKRYVALLEGVPAADEGVISLPLASDYLDRPRQRVDQLHGKEAVTRWRVVGREGDGVRVHLYPLTGRTHQLRVHAAHAEGLGCPIVGDALYGHAGGRLMLHAERLAFVHPVTGARIEAESPAPF